MSGIPKTPGDSNKPDEHSEWKLHSAVGLVCFLNTCETLNSWLHW